MNLENLSDAETAVVGQALRASADGPFFPDWEFHTLFGLTRTEVRAVADAWPNVELQDDDVDSAVHSSLLNLWGYPHGHGEDSVWSEWISISRQQLGEVFDRLLT
jgi:hypothetical protein